MSVTLVAIAPVFTVIGLGWVARRAKIVSDDAWGVVNRFGYLLLMPSFLFTTVATAKFDGPDAGGYVACLLTGFVLAACASLAWRLVFRRDGPAYTSVFQGSLRWNGFVLLAASNALYGPEGTALIALGFGPAVALVNVITVAVMARWADNDVAPTVAGAVAEVARNPLVLACVAGFIANLSGLATVLGPVLTALKLLGGAAMPVALLSVGAALNFAGIARQPWHVTAATFGKLMIAPAIMLAIGLGFGLSPLALSVAVGVASTPSAAAAYVMARALGGDAPLMAAIVTFTTVLSALSIPLWYAVAQALV
jgi:malonate transporter and related proteins